MSPKKQALNKRLKHENAGSWWSEHNNYHISTCLQKVDIRDVAMNFEATARHTGHKLMNT